MKHENTVKTEKTNENELVKILAGNCESIKDIRELLKNLFKKTLQSEFGGTEISVPRDRNGRHKST